MKSDEVGPTAMNQTPAREIETLKAEIELLRIMLDSQARDRVIHAAIRVSKCMSLAELNGVGTVREDPAPIEALCIAIADLRGVDAVWIKSPRGPMSWGGWD